MAPFGAIALFLSYLLACAPKAPEAPPEYPFPADAPAAFLVGPSGFAALAPGSVPGPGEPEPLPLARRVAALAADEDSGTVLAGINGFGLGILRLAPDGWAWKLLNLGLEETKSGSVAAIWPRGQGFLLELYRDPFVKEGPARNDAAPELLVVDASGKSSRLERLGSPGEDLFALFPSPSGKWYAELRSEKALGASTKYLELAWPESVVGSKTMTRADFEASLAPRPLSLAPASLRAAAEALRKAAGTVPAGAAPASAASLLVHARSGDGHEAYWTTGGSVEEALQVEAWIAKGEDAAVALAADGRAAFMRTGMPEAAAFILVAPLAGARFTSVTLLARGTGTGPGTGPAAGDSPKGIVAAAWDRGDFPDVADSGLVVAPLP